MTRRRRENFHDAQPTVSANCIKHNRLSNRQAARCAKTFGPTEIRLLARILFDVKNFERIIRINAMLIEPIEIERFSIRHFDPQDWQAVYAYTSDATVMSFIPEGQFTETQSRQFVEKNVGTQAEAYPVILKAQNKLIGHLIFHPWFAPQTYEFGWVEHPTYQGNGYATESAQALLQYCFEKSQGSP